MKLLLLSILIAATVQAEDFQDKLQKLLIEARPGQVIEIPEGKFNINKQLNLMVDGVTIKGKGIDKSILSFKGQKQGAEGFSVTANNVTFEDFTVQDMKGDGIKITRSQGITIRRMKVEWTNGPDVTNGGYGLYPVMCKDVLIEDSIVSGASDAGIYVGQSKNIIIRNNEAFHNVAGIEVENSIDADVYDNYVHDNTGGILVFDMPDLTIYGEKSRVFRNRLYHNNLSNFAPSTNSVGDVPAGTGLMVTANRFVEVFENDFSQNKTSHIILVSYMITGRDIDDENYNPFPEGIFIYNNTYSEGGFDPEGGSSEISRDLIEVLRDSLPLPFPDIIYDGSFNTDILENGKIPKHLRICIKDKASFINLDAFSRDSSPSTDLIPFNCELEKLPEI